MPTKYKGHKIIVRKQKRAKYKYTIDGIWWGYGRSREHAISEAKEHIHDGDCR